MSINLSSAVSVIVCVKDAENYIKKCLESIIKNNVKEIIVVDGLSKDNTVQVAKSFNSVIVLSDDGKGLARARQIGVEAASGSYIVFIGPDNILVRNFIENFVELKNKSGYDAASAQTRVLDPKTFWDRGLDFRWFCLMGSPGPIKVVGTPSIYDKNVFKTVKFNALDLGPNDDTDLADQLLEKNFKLGLVPLLVFDQNGTNAKSTWNRFRWYGSGDYFYYKLNALGWNRTRKLMSITHPLRQTFKYAVIALGERKFSVMLWLVFVMYARYYGWVSLILKNRR